jgi:hypothetical protein
LASSIPGDADLSALLPSQKAAILYELQSKQATALDSRICRFKAEASKGSGTMAFAQCAQGKPTLPWLSTMTRERR